MTSAAQLGTQVLDSIDDGDYQLILDFADVRMIDSAGIGILLSTQRRVQAAGGRLVVANPSDHVRKVFSLTGVDRSLTIS
jgi:anti-anti-sigma factor